MKAAVYYETGGPEVFRYEDVADPEVLPRRRADRGRGDQHRGRRHPQPGRRRDGHHSARRRLPVRGTIREVGEGVEDRFVGQRVVATMLWGSHAELVVTPAVVTWPIADGADIVAAACVPVAFGTADDCLFEFGHLVDGRDRADPGRRGRRRHRGDPARQARRRDRPRDRVERRPARAAEAARPRPRHQLLGSRLGRERARDHRGPRRRSRRRLGRRQGAQGSVACLRYRGRAITVGSAGRDPQPFDVSVLGMSNQSLTGVFLGAEIATERAQQMIAGPRRRRRRRSPAGAGRPHVSARRRGRGARVPREPPSGRPRGADPVSAQQAQKAEQFLALHHGDAPLLLPNPWDAGSAKILASIGFSALATTSAGFAGTLGRLDGGVTRDEVLEHARVVCAAVDLPVSADLENCFADEPAGRRGDDRPRDRDRAGRRLVRGLHGARQRDLRLGACGRARDRRRRGCTWRPGALRAHCALRELPPRSHRLRGHRHPVAGVSGSRRRRPLRAGHERPPRTSAGSWLPSTSRSTSSRSPALRR